MSARDSSNTDEVISEIFRSMNTEQDERKVEKIRRWADDFPYVNGGLFLDELRENLFELYTQMTSD